MKTARDVMKYLDAKILEMKDATGELCMDALVEYGDREAYWSAMRQCAAFLAIRELREELEGQIQSTPPKAPARRTTKKKKKTRK